MITKNVTLYLGSGPLVAIPVSQFDTMWEFVFSIVNNSVSWSIPGTADVVMNGLKPDGNTFSFSGTVSNGKAVVDCDVQMTAVAGCTECELSILSGGKVVGTANFSLIVEEAPKNPGDISSETTLPAYAEILEDIAAMSDAFLPAGGTTGQVLKKASDDDYDVEWGSGGGGGGDVFVATYNSTTSADIEAAYQAGKTIYCHLVDSTYDYYLLLAKRVSSTAHYFGCTYNDSNGVYIMVASCTSGTWAYGRRTTTKVGSTTPSALGSAAAGSSADAARADHVHAMPTAADVGAIPAPSSASSGNVLTYNGSAWVAAAPGGGSTEIFYATYGTTTLQDILDAYGDGLWPVCIMPGQYDEEYLLPLSAISIDGQEAYAIFRAGLMFAEITDHDYQWNSSTQTIPSAQTTGTPANLGTAARGSATTYSRSDHVHNMPSAADVGAIPAPSSPSSGDFLCYNGSAWVATTLATWQGGSY